jgi:cell wall-associated NlpC family hydrolase
VRPLLAIPLLAALLGAAAFGLFAVSGNSSTPEPKTTAKPAAADVPAESWGSTDYPAPRPRATVAVTPGEEPPPDAVSAGDASESSGSARDAARASDDEIRAELAQFKREMRSVGPGVAGSRAKVLPNGQAVPPKNAPTVVKQIIAAGNQIAREPYKWGGGHGAWQDDGYDCSGSVSFALAGAGLLDSPLNSSAFMKYGDKGEGEWVTLYTNHGHIFMVVAGIRFDTSGRGSKGSRWQTAMRSTGSYMAVHPPGL